MREILDQLGTWREQGQRFAVATVVQTLHSAPRPAGSSMAVAQDGSIVGSISGGCVESSVYELARQVLADGVPRWETFGLGSGGSSGEESLAPSLTCGGVLDVFVRLVDDATFPAFDRFHSDVAAERTVAAVTSVTGSGVAGRHVLVDARGEVIGSLGDVELDRAVSRRVPAMLSTGASGLVELDVCADPGGEATRVRLFVESCATPARMLVFGAVDFAAAVAEIGKFLGYHVTVCDARPLFATTERFPAADDVVVAWPHHLLAETPVDDRTVICVLTHDPKFDVPALTAALATPARYIGAMGSRRTHEDRVQRLRAAGVDDAQLARICSPIGLDLGARSPQETAIAIAAEIISAKWGGSGVRLVETSGAIHR